MAAVSAQSDTHLRKEIAGFESRTSKQLEDLKCASPARAPAQRLLRRPRPPAAAAVAAVLAATFAAAALAAASTGPPSARSPILPARVPLLLPPQAHASLLPISSYRRLLIQSSGQGASGSKNNTTTRASRNKEVRAR